MKLIDMKKRHREEYAEKEGIVDLFLPGGTYLSISGSGAPGGPEFIAAIKKLFPVVYTAKVFLLRAGVIDFRNMPLECNYEDFNRAEVPMERWSWKLQVRVPEELTEEIVERAKRVSHIKPVDVSEVQRVTSSGGRVLQTLHVGPHDNLSATYELLMSRATELGLTIVGGTAREIYLTNPKLTAPKKLKTLVRVGVK